MHEMMKQNERLEIAIKKELYRSQSDRTDLKQSQRRKECWQNLKEGLIKEKFNIIGRIEIKFMRRIKTLFKITNHLRNQIKMVMQKMYSKIWPTSSKNLEHQESYQDYQLNEEPDQEPYIADLESSDESGLGVEVDWAGRSRRQKILLVQSSYLFQMLFSMYEGLKDYKLEEELIFEMII
ncbi:hypothetical protein pb186bvf_020250 [Paramecium bursaria]